MGSSRPNGSPRCQGDGEGRGLRRSRERRGTSAPAARLRGEVFSASFDTGRRRCPAPHQGPRFCMRGFNQPRIGKTWKFSLQHSLFEHFIFNRDRFPSMEQKHCGGGPQALPGPKVHRTETRLIIRISV
ncbi:vesicle-associated membrane protein 4 isoform X2 [Hypanus sabinus]|uniref:vesicle-associated membrane protein 4 isoform X2 n=1 Tax=Hypanus sabinus TaxID=79690 RepID=UPI0028C3E601|nr:vesicle-associated membrane protein 4 isoform X2 [Hypanus sabinus]